MAEIFLGNLQLREERRLHRAEERRNGSRGWKSSGPFFTCTKTFGGTSSSGTNSALRLTRSGSTSASYTSAPHDDAAVRCNGIGEHVGAVGVGPLVILRAGLPLAVRLDEKPAEIRDEPVDHPPFPRHQRLATDRADPLSSAHRLSSERRSWPTGRANAMRPERVRQRGRFLECGRVSDCGLLTTLLIAVPLIPMEAFARA